MLRVTDAPGPKGKVVVEADVDETGSVKAVRVVTNETGSDERAESVKAEVKTVKFQPPVRHCKVSGFTYVYSKTF
jgi:TonB family protein